jgi:hypothetical protein
MSDKTRGLYDKFLVERTDGSSAAGKKHDGCKYFVLDLTHDPHALAGLRGYTRSLSETGDHPLLEDDLCALISRLEKL